jgi:autotransporter-associated beta strand protein
MKLKAPTLLCSAMLSVSLFTQMASAQTVYTWNGATNTTWATSTNWNGGTVGVTGNTFNARINVYNGAGQRVIYSANEGTTVYANTSGRGIVISQAGGNSGSMEITGGSFSTLGSSQADVIGNAQTATLTVSGGTFIGAGTSAGGTLIGLNSGSGTSTLNVSGTGQATFTRLQLSAATTIVNLDGGRITANEVVDVDNSGTTGLSNTTFHFNGGILQAGANSLTNFMSGLTNAYVRTGGANIDTNGRDITIAQSLLDFTTPSGGGLTKSGSGTLTLSGTNTYTGLTTINAGAVTVSNTGSLASGNALTLGASGSADFANSGQSLGAVSNANTATNALNFSAATGTVTLASLSGAGNTRFGSNGTVTAGISTGTVNAVGLLTASISGGTVGAGSLSSTTMSGGTTTVSGTATIGTMSSGTANLNGATSAITSLNGGTVNLGASTVLSVSNGIHAGSITGTGGGLTKTSAGTLTLSSGGTYSYTGATNVNEGTLVVNGNISTSHVTVASGATIGGSGTVGALTVQAGGFVNPGNSPGILNTGNYNQAGTLVAEITGLTAGTQHDQINVTGTVTLSGSLSVLATGGTYALDSMIFLILNDGIDAVNGTFFGLAQGDTAATFGGFDWIISYEANSTGSSFLGGNDVALRAIPEPSAALLGGLSILALLRRRRR